MATTRLAVAIALAAIMGTACARSPLTPNPGATSGIGDGTIPGYDAIDLGTLGGERTLPSAINDGGIIVGTSQATDRRYLGFAYHSGVMRALRPSQTFFNESADAINATGEIGGVVRDGRTVMRWNAVITDADLQTFAAPADPAPPPSRVIAVNAQGDLLVSLDDNVAGARALVVRETGLQDLGGLGARVWTYPLAWNERGQVVGMSHVRHVSPTYEVFRPFIWESGVMKDLGVLGGVTCGDTQQDCAGGDAIDINADGTVVGTVTGPIGLDRAFIWRDGVMSDLGAFEDHSTRAIAINDRGQVLFAVGFPDLGAFVWDNGSVQRVGSAGMRLWPRALGENGQVVGEMQQPDGAVHAFVWDAGALTDLGPGNATAVNARGDVIGTDGLRGMLWRRKT